MTILGPTRHPRLNEGIGLVYLALGIAIILSLVSYRPADLSWNTVGSAARPLNLIGKAGAHASDLLLQLAGLGALYRPAPLFALAWKWLRSEAIDAQVIKLIGAAAFVFGACTAFSLGPQWLPFGGAISAGGVIGTLLADHLAVQFQYHRGDPGHGQQSHSVSLSRLELFNDETRGVAFRSDRVF